MRHVEDVAKNEPCTIKQAQNNNATAKQHLHHKPSCAALETFTSRKSKRSLVYKSINQTATPKFAHHLLHFKDVEDAPASCVACAVSTTNPQRKAYADAKIQSLA
jgi:hypothetical protein